MRIVWVAMMMLMASVEAIEWSGYSKGFFIHVAPNTIGRSDTIVDGNVRIKGVCHPCEKMRVEVAYQLDGIVRDSRPLPASPVTRPVPQQYRVEDLDPNLVESDGDLFLIQNLDRALITCSGDCADVNIGRQAIAFGSARIINPTDIITPFTFNTLDQEERIGVDAVRVTIPTGDLSEIDGGFIAGRHLSFRQNAVFLRRRIHVCESDINFLVIYFRENTLLGFDIERPLGQAGFWLEAAYTFAHSFQTGIRASNYGRLSTGVDYRFSDKLYGMLEYHYSSAGTRDPSHYATNVAQVAYTQGAVYLLGRHYLSPGMTYEITPLWLFSAHTMINVRDPSAYTTLILEHNFKEDLYFDWGLFFGAGRPPTEFKLYANLLYFSVRYYF